MKVTEMRTKSAEELQAFVTEKRTELAEKRRSLSQGELANPRIITNIRREIAMALTVLKEQESAGSSVSSTGEEA